MMKKWYGIPAVLMAVVTVLGLFAVSCGQKAAPVSAVPIIIKVGLPTPLNDSAAPWGQADMEPYLTWIDLFNEEGFQVAGKTYNFELIAVDDHDSPEGGTAAARQLVYDEGCKFLAGHWSWSYDAISAITNPARVIFVTRTGGGINYDAGTQPYNVFGSPSKEVWVADVLAAHAKFPDKKIGLLEPASGLTPSDIVEINNQFFDPTGMNYQWEVFPEGTTDFTPYITRFAEGGCGLVYSDMGLSSTVLLLSQRWEAGYDWPIGQAGGLADLDIYIDACGYEAAQGLIGSYFGVWDFKETAVNPKYVAMCREVMETLSDRHGKEYAYTDWIGWLPSHLLILSQAMQQAGTVDDTDAIMEAIRGGTFDTTAGTFKMSGEETYGSAVVFGSPGAICIVQGNQAVYLAEHPVTQIP
jgi:ABC-type branched-subunit amino acid transport system substrate-binding protein